MSTHIHHAYSLAVNAHNGQFDKSGAPYILHILEVANTVHGEDRKVVALLHDIVEDTSITLHDLSRLFPKQIVEAVDAITHRKNETMQDYMDRVRCNLIARDVKLADIKSNTNPYRLERLSVSDRERLSKKYAKCLAMLEEDHV